MLPTVIVPGIKGSSLENYYPLDVKTTWSPLQVALGPPFDSVALAPNGDADLADEVVTRAGQLFPIAYHGLVDALRSRFQAPVYVFPYDWRLSNAVNARRLVQFVEALQRKPLASVSGWNHSFHFVCHSMGGLVFRQFLGAWTEAHDGTPPVDRVAFVATPHLGSLDAVEAMIRGETSLFEGRKEMRKLARTYPSVYELLPRFPDAVVREGQPVDLFQATHWQSNVTQPTGEREDVEQGRLDRARAFFDGLPDPRDPRFGLTGRMLCIYGDRAESTLVQVSVQPKKDDVRNWYDFQGARKGAGDEVVPVESAKLEGVPFIAIPYSAVSYFSELTARALSFHAFITVLDEVQTVVSRFLQGDPDLAPLNLG